jgi:hypothetical protein
MLKRSTLALLLSVCSATALPDSPPSISFAPFPLAVQRTYIRTERGTPAGKAELVSPFPNDFPPSIVIGFETGQEAHEEGRYVFLSSNYLRAYNIAELKTAPYKTIQGDVGLIRELLKRRPTKAPKTPLPDYPPRNAAHVLEARLSYLDASWGSGLFFVSQFTQDVATPNNEELVYLFQGLSKDSKYFVSADFCVTHPKVPKRLGEAPGEQEEAEKITERIARTLDKEPDNSFRPSLRAIRDWIATLKIHEQG